MSRNENYDGREQSLVKHFILQRYLERFAHIIGFTWNTITYVDCFSGPWESNSPDLSDTSFAIALAELRKARGNLSELNKSLRIRCLFLEEKAKRHAQLEEYAKRQTDIEIETRKGTLIESIPTVLEFIHRGGKNAFPFTFIDPTGGSGLDMEKIQPLLKCQPGEVLINFMTDFNRRFITPKESRTAIRDCYRRLYGTDEVYTRVSQLNDPQDREDTLFTEYAEQVRQRGQFTYTCATVVLHPDVDRTYFHLIYATRHPKGVEEFKRVEKAAFPVQERLRAGAEERKAIRKTNQPSLFASVEDQPPSPRADALRKRYLSAALKRIEALLGQRKQVPFDEIWGTAMAFPLVWDSDVKNWIAGWQKAKRVKVLNLPPRHKPKWGQNHIVEFLK